MVNCQKEDGKKDVESSYGHTQTPFDIFIPIPLLLIFLRTGILEHFLHQAKSQNEHLQKVNYQKDGEEQLGELLMLFQMLQVSFTQILLLRFGKRKKLSKAEQDDHMSKILS